MDKYYHNYEIFRDISKSSLEVDLTLFLKEVIVQKRGYY